MGVFNSDHGSNILGCGNLCTAGSQIFKTKEFTWFSEVNYFQCGAMQRVVIFYSFPYVTFQTNIPKIYGMLLFLDPHNVDLATIRLQYAGPTTSLKSAKDWTFVKVGLWRISGWS
jgi:hypothetical protein